METTLTTRLPHPAVRMTFTVALLALGLTLQATEWYVTPAGIPGGNGSKNAPFDLATALAATTTIQPGDTVWLRAGVYQGTFFCFLQGQAGHSITIRQYPGEHATIDGGIAQTVGGWVDYWGFELMKSSFNRVSAYPEAYPPDLSIQDGLNIRAPSVRCINLAVHDVIGSGLAVWSEAPDSEIYGCIIYANGWQGTHKGWGHGIYSQNQTGAKRIADNLVFNNYGNGIQIYGSSAAFLNNFTLDGNVCFNSGQPSVSGAGNNMTIGGNTPAQRITVLNNVTYNSFKTRGAVSIGVPGVASQDLLLRGNYFMECISIADWHQATLVNNLIAAKSTIVELNQTVEPLSWAAQTWDRNSYYSQEADGPPFATYMPTLQSLEYAGWTQATGFDAQSQYQQGAPSDTKVIVRPNQYEPGRANIIVFNWNRSLSVRC
jgi:hypothetical protein